MTPTPTRTVRQSGEGRWAWPEGGRLTASTNRVHQASEGRDALGVRPEKNCGLPVKKFAPCFADPLQCTAWSLHRFRSNHRSVQIARMLAREICTYRMASMLHVPRLKASLVSLRPMNCLGILGRHLRRALVLSVAINKCLFDLQLIFCRKMHLQHFIGRACSKPEV